MNDFKRIVFSLAVVLCVSITSTNAAESTRTQDIIYGRKFGVALTMDWFKPAQPNGAAIVFCVSGGWVSNHDFISGLGKLWCDPLLERGYTVFAVCHGCQPKFQIPEILQDMNRAVRFIRHKHEDFGIDPDRIGIMGGSAGGHLSLMQGTTGKMGAENAPDPIDRESSEVHCVACFFPPTDFLNYGKPGEDGVGFGTLKGFGGAFFSQGIKSTPEQRVDLGKKVSPIYFISENTPPTLIIHGDADELVPIQQAQVFIDRCKEFDVPSKLVVREGQAHGWPGMEKDVEIFADWFDAHLGKSEPASGEAQQSEEYTAGFVTKKFKDADGKEHEFVVFVPHGYDGGKAMPLLLFLHGAGEREGGRKTPAEVGLGPAIKKYGEKEFPFFAVFPRCGKWDSSALRRTSRDRFRSVMAKAPGTWGPDSPDSQRALTMLDQVMSEYKVDKNRLYLTGLSLGGFGTWGLAAKYPNKWAAIVPICGGGDPATADKIKHIPCWCFHGDADRAVPVAQSRAMIKALEEVGSKPRYDEYPGVGHNSWDRAYGQKELYSWLLEQKLK